MKLTPEDQLLLLSIKTKLNILEIEKLNDLIPLIRHWEKLVNNMIDRAIGPLFFNKLQQLPNSYLIPSVQRGKLQQAYFKTIGRGTVLQEHFRKVGETFAINKIPVIALKGIYLSEWLYGDIGLRQFSDIDLLVKEADALTCLTILTEMGYITCDSSVTKFIGSKSEIVHYPPMVKDGISIEIHIKLHRHSERYNLNIAECWKNAVPTIINQTPVYVLQEMDLLIHLCMHLDKHFREGHVQFTCFNDITNLLEKVAGTLNWDDFINSCRSHQCEDVVFLYIVLIHKYIHTTVPEHIIAKYSYLLTKSVEILFIKYLNGYTTPISGVSFHKSNLRQLTSFSDKFRYIRDIVFPPKVFMLQKYKDQLIINNEQLTIKRNIIRIPWWWLYLYRWWVGIKGVFKIIVNRR